MSYYALQKIEFPVRTNMIPRQIPDQSWYMQSLFSVVIGGILPFGAVFIELFFILSSVWLNQVRTLVYHLRNGLYFPCWHLLCGANGVSSWTVLLRVRVFSTGRRHLDHHMLRDQYSLGLLPALQRRLQLVVALHADVWIIWAVSLPVRYILLLHEGKIDDSKLQHVR